MRKEPGGKSSTTYSGGLGGKADLNSTYYGEHHSSAVFWFMYSKSRGQQLTQRPLLVVVESQQTLTWQPQCHMQEGGKETVLTSVVL